LLLFALGGSSYANDPCADESLPNKAVSNIEPDFFTTSLSPLTEGAPNNFLATYPESVEIELSALSSFISSRFVLYFASFSFFFYWRA